jgi:hypothetical protein
MRNCPNSATSIRPRGRKIIDAGLVQADQLVHTQYGFLREVVDSAGKALGTSDQAK